MLWRGIPLVARGKAPVACSNQWYCQARVDVCSYPVQTGTHRLHEVRWEETRWCDIGPIKVWLFTDTTCIDTLAASYRVHATYQCAGEGYCSSGGEEEQIISGSQVPPGHQFASITTGPKITSLPGVGVQDQTGDRRTQINGVPGSASVA